MKIQIWSDIMCPFCYLGDQNLKNAINEYQGNEPIEVEFKAFQLKPNQEKTEHPENPINYTIKYNGRLESQARAAFQYIVNEAKGLGLPIDVENAKVVNSLDTLRLVKYAQNLGKYAEVKDSLFRAYFAEGLDLSDHDVLLDIATKNGLNREETKRFLESDELVSEVNKDRNQGISNGLQGVPYFVIDNKYAISGNQAKESFLALFNEINPTSSNAGFCNVESGTCS